LNNLVYITRSVTNCAEFIPYICPYALLTDIPTWRDSSNTRHQHVSLLIKNREKNYTFYENLTNFIVYSNKCPLQDSHYSSEVVS